MRDINNILQKILMHAKIMQEAEADTIAELSAFVDQLNAQSTAQLDDVIKRLNEGTDQLQQRVRVLEIFMTDRPQKLAERWQGPNERAANSKPKLTDEWLNDLLRTTDKAS